MYKLDQIYTFIEKYDKIVLQFPNAEISIGVTIQQQLSKQFIGKSLILSSDHLHSSCCVDEVGAMHTECDAIVHFGVACFSETKLCKPIYYVLPYEPLNAEVQQILMNIKQKYHLLNEQCYDEDIHKFQIEQCIRLEPFNRIIEDQNINFGLGYYAKEESENLVFIGLSDSELFQRYLMQFESQHYKSISTINPITLEIEQYNNNQMTAVMKRCKQVEEALECNCFGLLINNPTAAYTKRVLELCKKLLKQNNKKYFTFSMNNLNEAKLGNFPEIDAYVIISCYKNSIIDTKCYYKLIITPFQLQQVFSAVSYTVESDLRKFNPEITEQPKQEKQEQCQQLIHNNGEIIPMNQIFQTLDFYSERRYQGLEVRPNLPPAKIEQGLFGIASSYANEGQQQ